MALQQSTPVTVPPPVHNDMPIMSDLPPPYSPPVQGEGINGRRRITPLRQLKKEEGPEPEWIKCPLCKKETTIRRVSEPSDEAKCFAICCCVPGIFLFFLPGLANWLERIDIHCGSCGKHIATVPPDGEVEIVRASNRPPLPSAK
ncbi:hypothetical protein F5Y12DRAFT_664077 [Xylaria sp. FL1777]|nr:hypothetical protein F5Y12DRAFT_664077 [Xylaria sp. FL1777]